MSMLSNNETDPFMWDVERLKTIRNSIVKSGQMKEEELAIIDCLIEDELAVEKVVDERKPFDELYSDDVKTIHLDYFHFLEPIMGYVDNNFQNITALKPYKETNLSRDEMIELLFDFFQELNEKWFNNIYGLYNGDNSYIVFSGNPSFSLYYPNVDSWVCNINKTGTIRECSDLAHEFGHGIQDSITESSNVYSPENILIEMFPMLMQILFMDYLKKNGIEVEQCDTELFNTYNSIVNQASSIVTKYQITDLVPNISNVRNLRRVLTRSWGTDITTDELTELFSESAKREMHYVLPYIVASNLYELYKKDQDLFMHYVNTILSEKEDKIEVVKQLHLM